MPEYVLTAEKIKAALTLMTTPKKIASPSTTCLPLKAGGPFGLAALLIVAAPAAPAVEKV
jgi:hypothetical protein